MNEKADYSGTRILTDEELRNLSHPLFSDVQQLLADYSKGGPDLLWALRHKLIKQLNVEEKGKQIDIRKLKEFKRGQQGGKCAIGGEPLPEKGAELDKFPDQMGQYTRENTRLVCRQHHVEEQERRGWK